MVYSVNTMNTHQKHLEDVFMRGKTTLMTSRSLLQVPQEILACLWNKLFPSIVEDEHNLQDHDLTCWRLPPIEKPSVDTPLKRKRAPADNPRGPYAKASYSFTGSYAQVTYNKLDHTTLFSANSIIPFPSTRTAQATHVALIFHNYRPPANEWQLYQASHLCGYSDCIRPLHLLWETMGKNNARRMCHVFGAYEVCPHSPQCFLRQCYGKFRQDGIQLEHTDSFKTDSTIS